MSFPQNRSRTSPAFSLIELLVVIAIIGALSVLLVPAFNNIGKSQLLGAEGNKIVNLINLASQNSAAKNAMTALIAVKGTSTNTVAFGLFEYVPEGAGWKQISQWQALKDGIVTYFPNDAYKFTDYPALKPPIQDFPAINYRGTTLSAYQYLIFLPSRSLLQGTSAQLEVAEGHAPSGSITFTRPAAGGGPASFYRVTVLGTSGRAKIDRP